ncbi:MAG: DEAD/DEAH box helicase [Acidimicrobiales bacterium]|nr:DEAD/DEAH box helicase [Acidimicrobiales bacterium]
MEVGWEEKVSATAAALVGSGRVVPALEADPPTGRYRSWWWPLPAASQRSMIASLLQDASPGGQAELAVALASEVDGLVRRQLVEAAATIAPRRGGRPTVPEAWARSLVSADPWLPDRLDPAKLSALAVAVADWIRSGAVVGGRARLCLRLHEPTRAGGEWSVELLAQDREEPSLVVSMDELWTGSSPFEPNAIQEVLAALARMARLAPELAGVLDAPVPDRVILDDRAVLTVLRERAGVLEDAGIGVLLPAWWSAPARMGLRARAKGSSSGGGSAVPGGFGLDSLVDFEWEAALGGRRLTKAELATLTRAAAAKQALVRLRGEWVEIRPDHIEALLARLGQAEQAPAAELMKAALGLGNLDVPAGLDVVDVDARAVGWLSALLDDAVHSSVAPVPTPAGFEGQLRPYQERGVGWMVFLGRLGLGACLADDMGLGKTAQVIAAMLADPGYGPGLVVCPVSVLGNWERELARFAPALSVMVHHGPTRHDHDEDFGPRAMVHDVVLTTYSLLARDRAHLASLEWSRIVLDEAQQVKNPGTAQTRAAAELRAGRRLALTGTPVENRLGDLWSIMHLLNPGLLGSAAEFRERFALPIERDGDQAVTDHLRRATGPFVLRRLKTDRSIIADLPDKIETVDRCPLTREQATLYQAVVDDLLEQAEAADGIQRRGIVLAGLSKLKQVCNHPAHFLADGSALAGRSGKLVRTEELLEEILAEGDKVLCFTQFAAWGNLLATYLQARFGVDCLWLHGRVRRPAREEMVQRFSEPGGPPVFLISLKAGGTGLNLTAASHVIHLDRWWNPAVEDQATDRAFRIGQRRNVQVHKLVSSGTVEERIDEMIAAKRDLAARVVGSGEQWLTELSTSELRALVTLSAEVE